MNNKYANGLYRNTSKKQDQKMIELWKILDPINGLTNFNQKTGDVVFTFRVQGKDHIIEKTFEVNRKGEVIHLFI